MNETITEYADKIIETMNELMKLVLNKQKIDCYKIGLVKGYADVIKIIASK